MTQVGAIDHTSKCQISTGHGLGISAAPPSSLHVTFSTALLRHARL